MQAADARSYDAVTLLADLRALAERDGGRTEFTRQIAALHDRFRSRHGLTSRLRARGLLPG